MADEQKNPNNNNHNNNKKPSLNSSSSGEIIGNKGGGSTSSFSGHYPNQRETSIPDAATLKDQWKFAMRQYSRWNSQAWGAAIFAGVSFFAVGWIIKGSNPLPSSSRKQPQQQQQEDDHK